MSKPLFISLVIFLTACVPDSSEFQFLKPNQELSNNYIFHQMFNKEAKRLGFACTDHLFFEVKNGFVFFNREPINDSSYVTTDVWMFSLPNLSPQETLDEIFKDLTISYITELDSCHDYTEGYGNGFAILNEEGQKFVGYIQKGTFEITPSLGMDEEPNEHIRRNDYFLISQPDSSGYNVMIEWDIDYPIRERHEKDSK